MSINKVGGRISRMYARKEGLFIRLDTPLEVQPFENYLTLEISHPNYNALYSLALSAAVNRYGITIRTTKDIVADQAAPIEYLVVDW